MVKTGILILGIFSILIWAHPSFARTADQVLDASYDPITKTIKFTGVIISPPVVRPWIIDGTVTQTIAPLQTKTIHIPATVQGYLVSSIAVSGIGGDATITIFSPPPHFQRVLRINPTAQNVIFDFGEGIKIDGENTIAIEIKSTDSELGQTVDVSWQTSIVK